MERITLTASTRNKMGKGAARAARRGGAIPAIVYREGKSTAIQVDHKEISRFLKKTAGEKVVVNLKMPDGGDKIAVLKDYQTDPVTNIMLHADFYEVSLTEKIKVTVPVLPIGEPIGVKRDKGIVQYVKRDVEVSCLPDKIPGHLEIDITELGAGQSVHVSDLTPPEEVEILSDPSDVIVTVAAPAVEEVVAAPAAAEEPAAPEVLKKGKKEEDVVEKEEKK